MQTFLRHFDKNLWSHLRQDFLDLNKKAYLLRYTDDLPVNFNIVIAQREYLAELDHTIISLIQGFNYEVKESGKGTKFTQLIARQDNRLLLENHVLNNIPKDQFVHLAPQQIYEMRYVPFFGPIETEYSSSKPAKIALFTRPGNLYRAEGGKHHFELSHFPIPPGNGP